MRWKARFVGSTQKRVEFTTLAQARRVPLTNWSKFSINRWAQTLSPTTSIIRTRIIKISRKPISPARVMDLDTSRGFRSKTVCAITCSGYTANAASLLGGSQIAKGFLRQLKFLPLVVGCRTQALVKLHPALIPSGDPPFDHSATALLSFSGNSFHQLFPYSSASMSIGDVELLDDEIRLRSISEGNKVINKNSDDGGVVFRNKTMKIRRRTPKSLFA